MPEKLYGTANVLNVLGDVFGSDGLCADYGFEPGIDIAAHLWAKSFKEDGVDISPEDCKTTLKVCHRTLQRKGGRIAESRRKAENQAENAKNELLASITNGEIVMTDDGEFWTQTCSSSWEESELMAMEQIPTTHR